MAPKRVLVVRRRLGGARRQGAEVPAPRETGTAACAPGCLFFYESLGSLKKRSPLRPALFTAYDIVRGVGMGDELLAVAAVLRKHRDTQRSHHRQCVAIDDPMLADGGKDAPGDRLDLVVDERGG